MRGIIILLTLIPLWSCNSADTNENFNRLVKHSPYSVVMFIAPDCPLCMTLSTPYSKLADSFPDIQFMGVMSGNHYEEMEINMYATENNFKPIIFRDYEYGVARQLKASVTPEFFLLDSQSNILYQGMMDDRILKLGSYKQQWDKHYLRDALEAVTQGKKPIVPKTEAIGCILEY